MYLFDIKKSLILMKASTATSAKLIIFFLPHILHKLLTIVATFIQKSNVVIHFSPEWDGRFKKKVRRVGYLFAISPLL